MTLLGKDSWKLALVLSRHSLGNFALSPFAGISCSPGDDCVLSPSGPPGDSPKGRVVLGRRKQWW